MADPIFALIRYPREHTAPHIHGFFIAPYHPVFTERYMLLVWDIDKFIEINIKKVYNTSIMTDRELLNKCVERDIRAWDEFVRRHRSLVLKSVRYKLRVMNVRYFSHEAEDIIQDIFLAIWEKNRLSAVRDPSALRGWLAMISINHTSHHCTRKLFKRENVTLSLDKALNDGSTETSFISKLSVPKDELFATIEYNDLRKIVDGLLLKLKPRQRLALKLNLYDGLKHKDIAKIISIPQSTATTLIHRGKRYLSENLTRMTRGENEYIKK
jgi:RNA polymerase sigma-70 factor, ECF subfamily